MAKERTGYPTQKPVAPLERILNASSNLEDIIFEPFCGCATTLVAADRLGRHCVRIDVFSVVEGLVKRRVKPNRGLFHVIKKRTDIPKRGLI